MTFVRNDQFILEKDTVAIALTPGAFGSHVGVVFFKTNDTPVVVHLAFHKKLACEALSAEAGKWLVCTVPLPRLRSPQVVAFFRAFLSQYPKKNDHPGAVDYGLNLFAGRGAISEGGVYSPKPGFDGFTCASFVNELFRRARVGLTNVKTWTPNEINKIWGDAVVCFLLCDELASAEHVNRVKANNLGFRLLPEEVAAAAEMHQGSALSHDEVHGYAVQLRKRIDAECNALAPLPKDKSDCIAKYKNDLDEFFSKLDKKTIVA